MSAPDYIYYKHNEMDSTAECHEQIIPNGIISFWKLSFGEKQIYIIKLRNWGWGVNVRNALALVFKEVDGLANATCCSTRLFFEQGHHIKNEALVTIWNN